MSLYHDAASVLSQATNSGSLTSSVYNSGAKFKSKPSQIYALISETTKYDIFFKEVIENAGVLAMEPKVCTISEYLNVSLLTDPAGLRLEQLSPLLSLLLIHDQFFSKNGIAAPVAHPLRQAVERNKARLQAEFTKSRLRRKCATVEELKTFLQAKRGPISKVPQPRWVRINRIKGSTETNIESIFLGYKRSTELADVLNAAPDAKVLHIDNNVADLVALPPRCDLVKTTAYKSGQIILQDKASCFPACLLLGSCAGQDFYVGDVIDSCAAPGNKTTHLAAICERLEIGKESFRRRIFACERDKKRSISLLETIDRVAANIHVEVLSNQDFLTLDPLDARFVNVTHLLLDPSCSGSGIIDREDIPILALPERKTQESNAMGSNASRKRKRRQASLNETHGSQAISNAENPDAEEVYKPADVERLDRLSNLQTKIVEHAFAFPAATKVTYSTCSVHAQENEMVVARVLSSHIARERGWRVLYRDDQVEGLRSWPHRGLPILDQDGLNLTDRELDACIRCIPGTTDGTMGFFVCGFIRGYKSEDPQITGNQLGCENSNDEWEGFSDT